MQKKLLCRIIDQAIAIQQVPAPPFDESARSIYIENQFLASGLKKVFRDEIGNVFACLLGTSDSAPLVVSAHLDTVFPCETDLSIRETIDKISGPGIGDNSVGTAGLLGLLWAIQDREISLPGDIWFVANVGEEGLGNLRGMVAVVEHFQDEVLAYLILEGMALGQIYNRGLGVERFRVEVLTRGGHSWVDYGKPSAIHEIADLVTRLTAISVPEDPRTTLNVGVIQGGTSINTVASLASFELDLRSESKKSLEQLVNQVKMLVHGANQSDVQVVMENIGSRPAGQISPDHPLVELAKESLILRGIKPNLTIGSTDANIPLSKGIPAICLGLTNGGGAHTMGEYIYTEPLEDGMEQLITLVKSCFEDLQNRLEEFEQ